MKKTFFLILTIFLFANFIVAQESLADLIVSIKPSVVKIEVLDENKELIATGSGFFISQTKVITNKHVVIGGKFVKIKMFDETIIYANKIESLPDIDISILEFKSDTKNIKSLSISSSSPREGDRIVVFGSPLGLQGSISDGLVSATRTINKSVYTQITAPISPGSSGGPVVNMSGRVVGIATLNIKGGQNLNFAIPANEIASLWVNQISNDSIKVNSTVKSEVKNQVDLTGNWQSLTNSEHIYQIIDGGNDVSIEASWSAYTNKDTNFDAKWVGDAIIGYHNDKYS